MSSASTVSRTSSPIRESYKWYEKNHPAIQEPIPTISGHQVETLPNFYPILSQDSQNRVVLWSTMKGVDLQFELYEKMIAANGCKTVAQVIGKIPFVVSIVAKTAENGGTLEGFKDALGESVIHTVIQGLASPQFKYVLLAGEVCDMVFNEKELKTMKLVGFPAPAAMVAASRTYKSIVEWIKNEAVTWWTTHGPRLNPFSMSRSFSNTTQRIDENAYKWMPNYPIELTQDPGVLKVPSCCTFSLLTGDQRLQLFFSKRSPANLDPQQRPSPITQRIQPSRVLVLGSPFRPHSLIYTPSFLDVQYSSNDFLSGDLKFRVRLPLIPSLDPYCLTVNAIIAVITVLCYRHFKKKKEKVEKLQECIQNTYEDWTNAINTLKQKSEHTIQSKYSRPVQPRAISSMTQSPLSLKPPA